MGLSWRQDSVTRVIKSLELVLEESNLVKSITMLEENPSPNLKKLLAQLDYTFEVELKEQQDVITKHQRVNTDLIKKKRRKG